MLRVLTLRVVVLTVIMLNVTAPQFESAILFIGKFENSAILQKKLSRHFHLKPSGDHRHLSNIVCLMAHTACFDCFISTVNGCSKKKRKEAY